jgi:hypothetical protein
MTNIEVSKTFSPEEALKKVDELLAGFAPMQDADIARVPQLDAAGLYAFSAMPRLTGKAGEVIYLVGPGEVLSGGTASDFDSLMARLGVGREPGVLDVHTFARYFMRLRVLRRGVVLDQPDGHVLLDPSQLPPEKFAPPRADFGDEGARYRFWMFDTDRLEPAYWDVRVASDGRTTFELT